MPYDPGTQFTITSGFGSRSSGNHPGVDFAAPNGTPIPAAADGDSLVGAEDNGWVASSELDGHQPVHDFGALASDWHIV
jgi:murein DD-endopeptidase MepM/ murein hydrolase activator NlpD